MKKMLKNMFAVKNDRKKRQLKLTAKTNPIYTFLSWAGITYYTTLVM